MTPDQSFAYFCVDRLYNRIIDGGDYSERTVKGHMMEELHAIQKAERKWSKRVQEPPLEVRTAVHEFKHQVLALKPRERNEFEITAIEQKLLEQRKDPLHYVHGSNGNGRAK